MGSQSSRCLMWAAQDGRLKDLLYHLQEATPEDLKPSSLSQKRQAPIHVAAISGHPGCVQALGEAGKIVRWGPSKLNFTSQAVPLNAVYARKNGSASLPRCWEVILLDM